MFIKWVESNQAFEVRLVFDLASYLFVLLLCQLGVVYGFEENVFSDVLVDCLEYDHQLLKVILAHLLLQARAHSEADSHQVVVPVKQVRVPKPRARVQAQYVRKERNYPLKEENTAL